jgi:outer membrane protein assembly factor BamB
MGGGAVIELDRAVVASRGPDGDWAVPPRWRRRLRLALAALLSGLALAAAAPLPGGLVEVAALDVTTIVVEHIAGGRLFVLVPGGGLRLVAYRLSDGRRLWAVPLDVEPGTAGLDVQDSTVLVSSGARLAGKARLVALDAGTGRERWRSDLPRLPGVGRRGAVLVATHLNPDGSPGPSPYGAPIDPLTPPPLLVQALDVGSGRPVWSYRVPAGRWTAFPYDVFGTDAVSGTGSAGGFVVVAPDGQASAVDLDTGAVRAAATIAVGTTRQLGGGVAGPVLAVRGDLLVVGYLRDGQPTVAVYRTGTLTRQWTATVRTLNVGVTWCGPVLCLNDEYGFRAVVPDTGRVAWSVTDAGWYGPVDRWLYQAPDPLRPGSAHLVDPATGRSVLDLGRWRLGGQATGQPPLFELVEAESGRIWLGLLGTGPHIRPVGSLTGLAANSCTLGGGYLACLTTTDRLRVWHYRA